MFLKRKQRHYEKVYKEAYKAFFVLCLRYCKSKEDAEEVFNNGMVKYFDFERKNKVRKATRYALIKKILINKCIDHTRKNSMHFKNIDETLVNTTGIPADVEYQQLKDEVLKIVQEMPPQTRLVFNLYIFEGWSHKEIADHLGISENTSFWHLNNGKKKVMCLFNNETMKVPDYG